MHSVSGFLLPDSIQDFVRDLPQNILFLPFPTFLPDFHILCFFPAFHLPLSGALSLLSYPISLTRKPPVSLSHAVPLLSFSTNASHEQNISWLRSKLEIYGIQNTSQRQRIPILVHITAHLVPVIFKIICMLQLLSFRLANQLICKLCNNQLLSITFFF